MARYFAGNSLAAFERQINAISEATTAGTFDPAYVPSSIFCPVSSSFMQSAPFVATGTFWYVFSWNSGNTGTYSSAVGLVTFVNGVNGVFKVTAIGSGRFLQPQFWNGSAWINTGPAWSPDAGFNYRVAIKVVLNSSFEMYVGNVLTSSGGGWSGSGTTITNVQHIGPSSNQYFSDMLAADYDIRDSHYLFTGINGNSLVNTGGTGTFSDVNETVLNDATAIVVAAVAAKMGQTKAALTVPSGYNIAAMVISARGRASGGVVTDGKLGIRTTGGVNNSGSALGFNSGYSPRQRIIDNDPDTGVPFLQAGYNGAQIYEEGA